MKHRFLLLAILLLAALLRFYNLLFDAPYFFNPDERNMANAIIQLRVPEQLWEFPRCLESQISLPLLTVDVQAILAGTNTTGLTQENPTVADCQLNPHFFAYGQLPLYLSFFSDQAAQRLASFFPFLSSDSRHLVPIEYRAAIFWLRFWSALSSLLTVSITYLLSKHLFRKLHHSLPLSLLSAFLVAVTPGLIQSAHFGTTESLLTFFFLTSLFLSLRLWERLSLRGVLLLALIIGGAIGTKLTGLFCLVPPFLAAVFQGLSLLRKQPHRTRRLFGYLGTWLVFVGATVFFAVVSSPYNLIDSKDFKSSVFGYERDVATGAYRAFYTRQFEHTTPLLFQARFVFPYALGWPIFLLGIIGIVGTIIISLSSLFFSIKKHLQREITTPRSSEEETDRPLSEPTSSVDSSTIVAQPMPTPPLFHKGLFGNYFILLFSFFTFLLPNAWLYAKWTRFMTPIFPFFSLFGVIFLAHALSGQSHRKLRPFLIGCCLLVSLPGIAFFSIYTRPDSRVTATRWLYQYAADKETLLFDTGNVIDIPLGLVDETHPLPYPSYTQISFDFYHLDENPDLLPQLLTSLEQADYILVPSRRIFANYQRLPEQYPLTNRYYKILFDGSLGFEKVAQISSFPALGPFSFPDEQAEETSTVFDHPVIRIYKKVSAKSTEEYLRLLRNTQD